MTRNLARMVALVTAALVALLAAAGTASAFEATVERAGAIRATSVGKLTFSAGRAIECNVTLSGALRAGPIRIAAGQTFGEISRVEIRECTGGTVREALFREEEERKWNMQFTENSEALGRMPNESRGFLFQIVRAKFFLSTFGELINCLYEGNAGALQSLTGTAGGRGPRYTTGTISALATTRFARIRPPSNEFCPREGEMRGTFRLEPVQTITVR